MGLFNAISNWRTQRFENHRSAMETEGKCPECNGRGFSFPTYAVENVAPYDCPGCNGTGSYEDWVES